jgi:hypothetical protein
MASKALFKMASLWNFRGATKYTQMREQGPEGVSPIEAASFEQSLEQLEADKFTPWPNFSVEEGYRDQHDRHSMHSLRAETAEVFFPHRTAERQNSNPVTRIKRMGTRFPVRDMSWMVGISFTIGSAVFVANGFFLLLPLIDPSTDFGAETPYLTPASSILGTIIFLGGSWAAVLEALNLKRGMSVTDGIEVEMTASTEIANNVAKVDAGPPLPDHRPVHSQSNSSSPSSNHPTQPEPTPSDSDSDSDDITKSNDPHPSLALLGSPSFVFLPTTHQLRLMHLHDLYFAASVIQLLGAIIFAIATMTSIPGVIDFSNFILVSLTNYLPASLGGLLFLVSSILQMLSTQNKWWKPNVRELDWHIGGWNAIGSAGFMLAGALPWLGSEKADFQASLANFWGSWAFLVGSLLQWYCAMGNYI